MELPDNFNKYNGITEWYRNLGCKMFNNHNALVDFYCKAKQINYTVNCSTPKLHYYIYEGHQKLILTEEIVYHKLAQLTDQEIEFALAQITCSTKLRELSMLTIGNKFNDIAIKVSNLKFQKYCNYCYDVCREFNVNDFTINIEFDQETADCVSKTINLGVIVKPSSFKSLVQYIEVIGLLRLNL
jgi:hypothetical protein